MGALRGQFWHWCLVRALGAVQYVESRDAMFSSGEAHSDASRVLPPRYEKELLHEYCNYVEVQRPPASPSPKPKPEPKYENSFIISSWCPPMQPPRVRGRRPMLVSYGCRQRLKDSPPGHFERNVTGREAHPCLTMRNLMLSSVVFPRLQGMHGGALYFAGSSITPGNGHDLSLLSGLVAAGSIGAAFPFPRNPAARSDFASCAGMMGLAQLAVHDD